MAKPNAKNAAVTTVTAKVPVEYDGIRYQPDESIDVRAEDLQQLLDVNAVEAPAAPAQ